MAASGKQLVKLVPDKFLTFHGSATATLQSMMTLSNVSDQLVAYKVKTTIPNKLTVEPPRGIVAVGQQITINVTLEKGDTRALEMLIQVVPVTAELSKTSVDTLLKDLASKIMNKNIKIRREVPENDIDETIFYSCKSTVPDKSSKKWWK